MFSLQQGSIKGALISGCLAIWCFTPGIASAVGFGKPSVFSAIGDPLKVSVPLVSIQEGELEDLEVGIADPSWYQLSGLDYSTMADQLQVELDTESASGPSIIVSTLQGINQIAVQLVLELTWPQRVMRKQFTVLLNPRGYSAINTAEQNAEAFISGADAFTDSPTTESEPVALVTGTISGYGSTSTSELLPSAAPPPAAPLRPTTVLVKRGDSLSTIVDRFLPVGASRFQGRMGFYNDNPEAFQNGDIHLLTSGVTMKVPDAEAILAIPPTTARQQYQKLASVNKTPDIDASDNAVSDNAVSDTAETTEDQSVGEGGFSLSVVEAEVTNADTDEGLGETESVDSSADSASSADINAEPPAENTAVSREQFEMQGFTMKLTVLNAYIVELQDENQLLKDRVLALEQKVEALIRSNISSTEDQLAFDRSAIERAIEADQMDASLEGVLKPLETGPEQTEIPDTAEDAAGEVVADSAENGSSNLEQAALGGSDQSAELGVSQNVTNAERIVAEQSRILDGLSTKTPGLNDTLADLVDTGSDNNADVLVGVGDATVEVSASDEAEVPPRLVYRQDLIDQATSYFKQFDSPLMRMLLAAVLVGLMLLGWVLHRGKNRRRGNLQDEDQGYAVNPGEQVGVTYSSNNNVTLLDIDDDDALTTQQEIKEENLTSMQDSDVDLITQSEVYLTYNRPMQAVQALLEEYAKPDCDKFVVASRLLKIYEQMGEDEERNDSLRAFIVTLNKDGELYSSTEWDNLRQDLDALRRSEQQNAVGQNEISSQDRSAKKIEVPGSEITLSEDEIDFQIDTKDNVVELEYHPSDKAGST